MKFLLKFSFMILSDIYRSFVYMKELFLDLGDHSIEVAYITNFQNDIERGFMGISSLWKNKIFVLALKLRLHGIRGRYLAINSVASDMIKNPITGEMNVQMHIARSQVAEAIKYAYRKGAKVVLFAASTKRLFSEREIRVFAKRYNMIFTIGDNGTALALLKDVQNATKDLPLDDNIVIIGPNGFLGSIVKRYLSEKGFKNILCVSQKDEKPFEGIENARVVVACSHHPFVRLNAAIVSNIAHKNGMHVVDVCKPVNFSQRELAKVTHLNITRQDAGNMMNVNLLYDCALIANVALQQLGLSQHRLFGCFSEATALASCDNCEGFDFLSVNDDALKKVEGLFTKNNFKIPKLHNFGKIIEI